MSSIIYDFHLPQTLDILLISFFFSGKDCDGNPDCVLYLWFRSTCTIYSNSLGPVPNPVPGALTGERGCLPCG